MNIVDINLFTVSRYGLSCPSSASSVTTTVPGGNPMPPQVPILTSSHHLVSFMCLSPHLMKTGSLTPAWYMSLMTSCRRIPAEGIPIPWEMERTGPTLYMAYLR